MVRGLDLWKDYFAEYADHYVLIGGAVFKLPESLQKDISDFCGSVQHDLPNIDFMKSAGLGNMNAEDLIVSLKRIMNL